MYKIRSNKKLHLYKTVLNASIENLQNIHQDNPHDLFWAYNNLIFENIPLPKTAKNKNLNQTFWEKLTKPQQVVRSLGVFISQVNNGGIWQFFFNNTEYIAAVGESFQQFGSMNSFSSSYDRCFNELAAILDNGEFFKIHETWNNENLSHDDCWAAFKSGETHITSHKEFEDYFYSEKGKNRLYDYANKYIFQNLGAMVALENENIDVETIIDKKNAVPHFTDYLTKYYKVAPSEVSIYYTANVTIKNTATKLFLMKFIMPDGYESLGITGYFTHNLEDVDWADIKNMYQKHHKQELINIYYGWYLVTEDALKNPRKNEFEEDKWLELLAKLQDKKNTQIPVNVKFKACFFYKGLPHYTYMGDLLYNEKTTIYPTDLSNVPVLGVRDKGNSGYIGELNCLFSSVYTNGKPHFGRQSPKSSIDTKRLWERFIGRNNKLVKDNPWGF
jgi:hypothetical protein